MSKKLSEELGKILDRDLDAVITREINEPDYLAFEQFEGEEFPNMARAKAILDEAMPNVLKTLALACAKDSKERKGREDTAGEIMLYSSELSDEDTSRALMGWWGSISEE